MAGVGVAGGFRLVWTLEVLAIDQSLNDAMVIGERDAAWSEREVHVWLASCPCSLAAYSVGSVNIFSFLCPTGIFPFPITFMTKIR